MDTFSEKDFILAHNIDLDDLPTGTELIPVTYIKNGKEAHGYVALTPAMIEAANNKNREEFEKEKARVLDIIINKNVKNEKRNYEK